MAVVVAAAAEAGDVAVSDCCEYFPPHLSLIHNDKQLVIFYLMLICCQV